MYRKPLLALLLLAAAAIPLIGGGSEDLDVYMEECYGEGYESTCIWSSALPGEHFITQNYHQYFGPTFHINYAILAWIHEWCDGAVEFWVPEFSQDQRGDDGHEVLFCSLYDNSLGCLHNGWIAGDADIFHFDSEEYAETFLDNCDGGN